MLDATLESALIIVLPLIWLLPLLLLLEIGVSNEEFGVTNEQSSELKSVLFKVECKEKREC